MELSVSQIADLYGVNRSQLTAQFRAYYGQSLSEFIYTKRLDRAKLLLESHPTWGLEQVAQEAGYCSLSTMYRAFQRSGLGTPASYRPK
jgi:transcriptional regulator GlxA family with amidase domain